MPLFEGHRDSGLQRLFIEMPDQAKGHIAWKWPDQQIVRHSQLNVDLDYQAVFTNLGEVIGVIGPGRHALDEGAPLTYGWLVDRLTGDAFYNAELYFVATRDITGVEFGGPVDNLTDGPTGLVVTLRVFGELAFRATDPTALLARLIGTGAQGDFDAEVATWVKDQTLAAIRAVLPDIVAEHGVLAMGQLQDATATAALAKANAALAAYGLALSTFGELNVNLPDADAAALKQLAATKAYTAVSGSFDSAVRGEAALDIAHGISTGAVGAQQGLVAGMMLGVPVVQGGAGAPGVGVPAASGGGGAPGVPSASGESGEGIGGGAPAAPPGATAGPSAARPEGVLAQAGEARAALAGEARAVQAGEARAALAGGARAVQAGEARAALAGEAPAAQAGAPVAQAAHFCSQCGAPLAPGSRFCAQCGATVPAAGARA
jgi:membrane protease subunit (stomatin/prohibitin family)